MTEIRATRAVGLTAAGLATTICAFAVFRHPGFSSSGLSGFLFWLVMIAPLCCHAATLLKASSVFFVAASACGALFSLLWLAIPWPFSGETLEHWIAISPVVLWLACGMTYLTQLISWSLSRFSRDDTQQRAVSRRCSLYPAHVVAKRER